MKLSHEQVRSSLEDLRAGRSACARARRSGQVTIVPAGVRERIAEVPRIRGDAVATARAWLDCGLTPSADVLAGAVLGRLISDRLR